jgi:hypothetical protein
MTILSESDMDLLKALQNTLTELSRARVKSGRSLNEYNYIRSRVLNSVELYFNDAESYRVIESFGKLPHRVSQQPDSVESHQLALFLQHLIDDFTSVLLMVEKKAGDVRELFISDKDFAYEILSKHSSGWMDSCQDCGQSLHLKYDLFAKNVVLAQKRLRKAEEVVCSYRQPKPLELDLLCPSKRLLISDSLNEFVVTNSSTLKRHYNEFVSHQLRGLSSTSLKGKALLSEFYASHNLGHFFVGKGPLFLSHDTQQAVFSKHTADQTEPFIQVRSMFVTMMDYAEFSGFCNQLGLDIYETLKAQDARLIDLEQNVLRMRYAFDDSTQLPTICLEPGKTEEKGDHFIKAIA